MRTLDQHIIMKFLAGQASPQEAEQVDEWLNSSSQNKEAFNRLWQVWSQTGAGYRAPDVAGAWAQLKTHVEGPAAAHGHEGDIEHRTPKTMHRGIRGQSTGLWRSLAARSYWVVTTKLLAVAGGLTITAAVVFHQLKKNDSRTSTPAPEVVSNSGEDIVRDTLSGGLVVTMDRHTTIRHDSSNTLLDGGVYVKNGSGKTPFSIKAGDWQIHSSGASYLLTLDSATKKLTIDVFSGEVDVDGKKLSGGSSLGYDLRSGSLTTGNGADSNSIAFATGMYTFRNASLKEVMDVLARAYHVHIIFKNPCYYNDRITAQFDNSNLSIDQIMKIIAMATDLTFAHQKDNKTIIVDGHGCD